MKPGWVALGVVLLLVGVALWYVPVAISVGSQDLRSNGAFMVEASPVLAILSPKLPFTATWSNDAGDDVVVHVFDCGTDSQCTHNLSGPIASGIGVSGSVDWSGVRGEYYAISPVDLTGSKTTVHASVGEPIGGGIVGVTITAVGAVLTVLGAVRRS